MNDALVSKNRFREFFKFNQASPSTEIITMDMRMNKHNKPVSAGRLRQLEYRSEILPPLAHTLPDH